MLTTAIYAHRMKCHHRMNDVNSQRTVSTVQAHTRGKIFETF